MAITHADVIQSHIEGALAQLYTSMPATIVDVSELESRNVISVAPCTNKVDSEGDSYPMAIIEDVPVQWPAGGGAVLTFPLAVGDDVTLVCSMTSIVEWFLSKDSSVVPFDTRRHDISDSIAIPCIFREANNPQPSKDNVVLKFGGKSLTLEKSGGDLVISSDTNVIINSNTQINGNVDITASESFSVTNSTAELISALNDALIAIATSNCVIGSPLTKAATITAAQLKIASFIAP